MSSFAVTVERLTITEHSNADALELAQVGEPGIGYQAVVGKGVYQSGEYALYLPEASIVPPELLVELGLEGKLAGSKHNRIKAVRLRGELSQGVVCRPAALQDLDYEAAFEARTDFAELLGIVKYVPEIPASMNGVLVSAPDLMKWVDIENVKRFATVFSPGEPVVATEKVHGTCCLATFIANGEQEFVSSKGYGSRGAALEESASNLYWRAVRGHGVLAMASLVAKELGATRVGIYGEVYGAGVQDLAYGATGNTGTPGYALFDISAELPGRGVVWLDPADVERLAREHAVPMVPRLYEGPYDYALLASLAEGKETVSGQSAHLREGLVVRPAVERYSPELGTRAIVKFVAESYLTRKGGTEFE